MAWPFLRRESAATVSPVRIVGSRQGLTVVIDWKWLEGLPGYASPLLIEAAIPKDGVGDWGGADYQPVDLEPQLRRALIDVLGKV
jgi:hypothetical protein